MLICVFKQFYVFEIYIYTKINASLWNISGMENKYIFQIYTDTQICKFIKNNNLIKVRMKVIPIVYYFDC